MLLHTTGSHWVAQVAALALPPPTAGQFLVPELLEGWEPAQLGEQLQLNIRLGILEMGRTGRCSMV